MNKSQSAAMRGLVDLSGGVALDSELIKMLQAGLT